MSNETWQRRKHTATKPNWIVRSTYNTVDWFGDFNGLKRSAASRIGKSILTVVDITILLCLFAFSAIHSFEMLEKFGITGVTQWLAIIFFEVNFLYSSVALDIAKRNGEPLGSRRGIFYICLLFVEASNVTALWGSVGGVLIGGVMPIMLLLKKETYKKKTTTEDSRTEERPADQVEEIITENTEEKPDEKVEENPVPEPIEPIVLADEKTDEVAPENTTDIIQDNPVAATEDIPDPNESNVVENHEDIPTEDTPDIAVEKVDENPEKTSKDKPKRTKRSSGKKKPKKSKKNITTDIPTIIAVAQQLKAAGIFSRAELERQANTTTHYAKKAIAELEEMEAKNPSDIQAKLSVVAGGRN